MFAYSAILLHGHFTRHVPVALRWFLRASLWKKLVLQNCLSCKLCIRKLAQEWNFHFGFVIPNSTNTWQQIIEAGTFFSKVSNSRCFAVCYIYVRYVTDTLRSLFVVPLIVFFLATRLLMRKKCCQLNYCPLLFWRTVFLFLFFQVGDFNALISFFFEVEDIN